MLRRAPGQRRRRTRREDELARIEAEDPAKHAELLELRRYNPQAYRKELRKLVRKGVIGRGRGYEVDPETLALLASESGPLLRSLQALADADALGFRAVGGLIEEEAGGAARPEVLGWLREHLDALLAEENRALP